MAQGWSLGKLIGLKGQKIKDFPKNLPADLFICVKASITLGGGYWANPS
jgi:hypothetical protein